VLRNPVLIGSKELLMMPPFAILMPPFTLIVDAFRVEGIPPLVPGGYMAPFMDDTKRLAVLTAFVMIGAVPIFVRPPLNVRVDAFRVEGITGVPLGGGYTAPFTDDTKRLPVLTVKELRAFVMIGAVPILFRPPLKLIVDAFRVEGIPPLPPGG
jgi:hypothetical protein